MKSIRDRFSLKSQDESQLWMRLLILILLLQKRKQYESDVNGVLRVLVIIVGLVLIALILSTAGGPEEIIDVIRYFLFFLR